MELRWSTKTLPAHRRFNAWRDICMAGYYPLRATRDAMPDDPFTSGFRIRNFGGFDIVDLSGSRQRLIRHADDKAAGNVDTYHLMLLRNGGIDVEVGRVETRVIPGTVLVFDPNHPFRAGFDEGFAYRLIRIPRSMLDPILAPRHRNTGFVPVAPTSPTGALLAATMAAMTTPIGPVAPEAAGIAVRTLCDLLALGIGPARDHTPAASDAVRTARLDRARRIIEARHDDPTLSPATVAAELGISYRTLTALFEPTGTTFAQTLTNRRLDAAHTALTTPQNTHRTIADIAYSTGFTDLSTFHRTYRRRFNLTPADTRALAHARHLNT